MNLNNKGFGTSEMIIYFSLILLFFIIVVFGIYRLYHGVNPVLEDNSESQKSYAELEEEIKNASIIYANSKEIILTEELQKVSIKVLRENNLLKRIYDNQDRECDGYALLSKKDEFIVSVPFLKCNDYESEGYVE